MEVGLVQLALALQAEQLGYDHIWVVEHHFEDYSFCPDNFVPCQRRLPGRAT